jgi:hypothetical protein
VNNNALIASIHVGPSKLDRIYIENAIAQACSVRDLFADATGTPWTPEEDEDGYAAEYVRTYYVSPDDVPLFYRSDDELRALAEELVMVWNLGWDGSTKDLWQRAYPADPTKIIVVVGGTQDGARLPQGHGFQTLRAARLLRMLPSFGIV